VPSSPFVRTWSRRLPATGGVELATTGPVSPERAREIVASLISGREALRRNRADRAALEANRLAIVYWQSRLSRSTVDEY